MIWWDDRREIEKRIEKEDLKDHGQCGWDARDLPTDEEGRFEWDSGRDGQNINEIEPADGEQPPAKPSFR